MIPNTPFRLPVLLGVGFWLASALAGRPQSGAPLVLTLRSLEQDPSGSGRWKTVERQARWSPAGTAAVICDMWDRHWCQGATARVAEMAPRMNRFVAELRRRGVLVIHCPSGTLKFYEGTPQRQRAQSAPKVPAQPPLQGWCSLDPSREAPLPIDDSDGGCDDDPRCQSGSPWQRQIATLDILEGDAITDSAEAWRLMRQRGITNVLVMGVHENMCVLGRPFSIRQMVRQGQNVVLVRDLTDTMYNSRKRPQVDHFTGTELVAWHIEKYWCPTMTSDQVLGGRPFRFAADTKPPRDYADHARFFAPAPPGVRRAPAP